MQGALLYANGDSYRGELLDRRRHGIGRCVYADGAAFDGGWRDDEWHSSPDDPSASVFTSKEGNRYEGEFTDGALRSGGSVMYHNGDQYTGHLRGLQRWGEGTCEYAAGGAKYEGQWAHDVRHGEGKQVSRSGDMYEGGWEDDAPHGVGKCRRYVTSLTRLFAEIA